MSKYKAKKEFMDLGIEECYQGLETEKFYQLRAGKEVEIKNPSKKLLEVLEIVKEQKNGNRHRTI